MTSTSSRGSSIITLQFSLDLSIDVAEQEVQAAINAASNLLPRDLPNPPVYSKINPADAPILTLALTSTTLPLSKVEDLADTRLAQKISQLSGRRVGQHQRRPKAGRANSGESDGALAGTASAWKICAPRSRSANVNQAKGNFDGPHQAYYHIGATISFCRATNTGRSSSRIETARRCSCRTSPMSSTARRMSGRPAWMNTDAGDHRQHPAAARHQHHRGRRSNQEPAAAAESHAAAISRVTMLTDRTNTIRASVKDVQFELMLTIALVVMVIFLFLRTVSGTVIPSVAVPLSLVGTFGVMYLLGYSLNNLTLMALTIATGFVVDDAIVMIENIFPLHRSRRPSAGSRAERRCADRLHDHFVDGFVDRGADSAAVHGRRRRPSVPRVRRHFERDDPDFRRCLADVDANDVREASAPHTPKPSRAGSIERRGALFDSIIDVLRRDAAMGAESSGPRRCWSPLGTFVVTVLLYVIIPKGFFPVQDTGVILGISEAEQTVSFSRDGGTAAGAGAE